jgi:hypothetical protein
MQRNEESRLRAALFFMRLAVSVVIRAKRA